MVLILHQQTKPTLDHLFSFLRTNSGLFFTGAGTSAGLSPLGREFWRVSPLDYLLNQGSFPAEITPRHPLTNRMIENSKIKIKDLLHNLELRPGTEEYPIYEILKRLPDAYAREQLKHKLAQARYHARINGTVPESYRVFRAFQPSFIADYNHDGLATEFCADQHTVVEMHGSIDPSYGSPELRKWLAILREFDVALSPDNLIMGLPESWTDMHLYQRLSWIMSHSPKHVTIIGYSFARMGNNYDDQVTLACFIRKFKHYFGAIFVISPDSNQLCEMLSDALEINTIYPIKRYWNILAHAFLESYNKHDKLRSLEDSYGYVYDQYGSDKAFPILE